MFVAFFPLSVRRGAFSTGFIFKYEGGADHVMRVEPVYQTVKDEVFDSGYLSKAQWSKLIEVKALNYLNTTNVKKMIGITKEHIYVVILYCDCTKLCTAVSASFRRRNIFETIQSVKQRHSKFFNFGRLLTELVLKFGGTGRDETGPFFCGLNHILNVGSYAITLKGPCSTSTVRTVAMNFATEKGIILKLDNDTAQAREQKFFDCSWISNYFEESERLWISGKEWYPLRIASIVIVRTANNYRKMMRALFLFDTMISGVPLSTKLFSGCKIEPTMEDYELLQKLIHSDLSGGIGAVADFDEYLKNEWALFLRSKEEIVLNWSYVRKDFYVLSNLVVFNLVQYKHHKAAKGMNNVLKVKWLSLFPAVHTVSIDTGGPRTLRRWYKFRLEALLSSMQMLPRSVRTVIVKDYEFWAQTALTGDIVSLFVACGWIAEYQKREHRLVFTLKSE